MIPAALLAAGLALALQSDPAAPAAAAAPPPAAAERLRLERLAAPGLEAGLVEAVENGLCAALAEAAGVEVACPADLVAAAQVLRQSVVLGATTTEDGLRQLAAAEAAGRLVRGALTAEGRGYRLRLTLSGPGGGGASAQADLPGDLEPLLARLPALARQLLK